jgi:hypothetical protein
MARRRKLLRVRGPRVRVTPSGKVRLNRPSVRIGGRRTGDQPQQPWGQREHARQGLVVQLAARLHGPDPGLSDPGPARASGRAVPLACGEGSITDDE